MARTKIDYKEGKGFEINEAFIREQYGLTFYKIKDPKTGQIFPICTKQTIDQYSQLQFISHLNVKNVEFLIGEIENAENDKPYDQYPSSSSYEDVDLELNYPNVIINEALTIPILHFKELLIEWKWFLENKSL